MCWSIQNLRVPGSHPGGSGPGQVCSFASAFASGIELEACCGRGFCYSSCLGWRSRKSSLKSGLARSGFQ